MQNPSVCLYRSLTMIRRVCRAEWVETIELIVGVRRDANQGIEGHAWLLINGQEFRHIPDIWKEFQPILRLKRRIVTFQT